MKKRLFITAGFLLAAFCINAQDPYRVTDWKSETTLRTYLMQQVHHQYDLRRASLDSSMRTKEGIMRYREECRNSYMSILGSFPGKHAMRSDITGKHHYKGYSTENIILETLPGHHLTANLYLPEGNGPFPAVILFCGHEMTSKATESYQKTAILFALNGFVVMVADPVSQGEMVQFTDSLGQRILRGSTTEHTLLNAGANLVGTGVVAWELDDNIRALDYLCSRPEVDDERIGCLGNSGGGTQTTYFIAFDDRIKVAAPCSYIARRERNLELCGASDGCQHIPSEGLKQLEIADFLVMFAPKPLLILSGRYDFVDFNGTEETYNELSGIYNLLGAPEKVQLFTYDDGHGISKPKREAAVSWFIRWLSNSETVITEPFLTAADEKDTWCTSTGQVNSFFMDEKNVQDYSLQLAGEMEKDRKKFMAESSPEIISARLMALLKISDDSFSVKAETTGVEKRSGYEMHRVILRRKDEVPLPILVFIPHNKDKIQAVTLWLDDRGKSLAASDTAMIRQYMSSGATLVIADLRGMGEMAEKPEMNEWKYYNREYHNAMISLHLGKPLPGQRVRDVQTLVRYANSLKCSAVKIKASGSAGTVAVYSALLCPEIAEVEVNDSIKSFLDILQNPMEKDWYSYVVPGILKYFDLPDLVAAGKGRIIIN